MQTAATQRGEIQALHVLAGTVKEQALASRASDMQTIATLRVDGWRQELLSSDTNGRSMLHRR
jgi:hypothetical protein